MIGGREARRTRFRVLFPAAVLSASSLCACVPARLHADRSAFAVDQRLNAIPPGLGSPSGQRTLLLDVRLDRQIARNGCGAHVAASLLDYWWRTSSVDGRSLPPSGEAIYRLTPPASEAGYSLSEVVTLLERQGLVAMAAQVTPEGIVSELRAGRPVIVRVVLPASVVRDRTVFPTETPILTPLERSAFDLTSSLTGGGRLDHYWLVVGQDQGRMIVLDPVMGLRAVSHEAFGSLLSAGGDLGVVSGGWA